MSTDIEKLDKRSYGKRNKTVRQELVREEIAAKCKITHVLKLAEKIEKSETLLEVQKYKAAADIKLKLISKYIPDLKATEITLDVDAVDTIKAISRSIDYAEAAELYAKGLKAKEATLEH